MFGEINISPNPLITKSIEKNQKFTLYLTEGRIILYKFQTDMRLYIANFWYKNDKLNTKLSKIVLSIMLPVRK